MLYMILLMLITTTMITVIMSIPLFITWNCEKWWLKNSAFECGMMLSNNRRNPFSIRFFSINNLNYYLWYWNCSIISHSNVNPMKCNNNNICNIIHYYLIKSTFMWMNWSMSTVEIMNCLLWNVNIILMNTIITMSTWTLLSVNNPMNWSMMITMTAVIPSILTSLMMSSWFAMMMLLIYVGGMMVMLSYFVSLSSNDSMAMKTKLHLIIPPFIMIKMLKLQLLIRQYNGMGMNELYM